MLACALCLGLSAVVLGCGLALAASVAFGRASLRLDPTARHDYVLSVLRRGRRAAGATPRLLLELARLDVGRGEPLLAACALAHVDTARLDPSRLKLLYLLQAVTAIQLRRDAREAAIRYAGIAGEKDAGFPSEDVVSGWARAAAEGRAPDGLGMREACAKALPPRRRRPLLIAGCSAMLAHCLFFLSVAAGVDGADGWRLRLGYELAAGLLASGSMVALAVVGVALLARWRRRRGEPASRGRRVACAAASCLSVLAVSLLALVVALGAVLATDGTERVLARGVRGASVDGLAGGPYECVAVDMSNYAGGTLTTYWLASDPIVMREWPSARALDTKTVHSGSTGDGGPGAGASDEATSDAGADVDAPDEATSDAGADVEAPDGATSDAGAAASASDGTTSDAGEDGDAYAALEDQVRAVAQYLRQSGAVPGADDPTPSYDAKGHPYASLGTEDATVDGRTVRVEYLLRDNGESREPAGTAEEFVLERAYPDGESDVQLLGFYLVDHRTLAVTDEHRTSW